MPKDSYHLVLCVNDITASERFYSALFEQLAWQRVCEEPELYGYSDGRLSVWIKPALSTSASGSSHEFQAVGFHHLAIRVPRKKDVNRLFEWCKKNNVHVVDTPAAYPEYSERYYAVFFLDTDGMKIEIMWS